MTIGHILAASVLIPAMIGTYYFRSLPLYGKYLVAFIYATLASEVFSVLFAKLYGNNMIVFYFYSCAVALCIGVAYSKLLKRRLTVFYLVPVVAIIESFVSGPTMFNSISFTILNVLLIITSLMCYTKIMLVEIGTDVFCFNGVLLFAALSNILFYFTAFFLQRQDLQLMGSIFGVHSWINMVTNLAYGYSLWILSKSYLSAR
jgi:hypothetical protein